MQMTHLKAKELFIAGNIDEAWEVAQQDEGLLPDVTKELLVKLMLKLTEASRASKQGETTFLNYRAKIYRLGAEKPETISLQATTYGMAVDEIKELYLASKDIIAFRLL